MSDLLRHHDPEDLVAFGDAGPKTAADLQRDAAKIAVTLPPATKGSHALLVISADRYEFAAALLAAWQAGHAVALPPNHRSGTIGTLLKRDDVAVLLHDTRAGGHTRIADVLAASSDGVGVGGATTSPSYLANAAGEPVASVFTSGTTGASEAWPKTAAQLFGEVSVLAKAFAFERGGRFAVTVPPSHLYGLLFGVLVPLCSGGAFLRETPLLPAAVAAKVAEFSADTLISVPVHLRAAQIVEKLEVKRIFSSTAPLSEETSRYFADAHSLHIIEVFGSTETGGIATRQRAQSERWQPLHGVHVDVTNEGRLRVDSPFLHPAGPRPRTTADLAELHDDGTFTHRGRVDGIVKIGGVRVSLPAMQRRLLKQPGVEDAEVVALPAEGRGVRILAAVASSNTSDETLRTDLADEFHPSAVPRRVHILPELPREPSGKLPRERLLLRLGLGPDGTPLQTSLEFSPPKTEGDTVAVDVTIPTNYSWFQGHFDTYPVLAGAVQLSELVLPIVAQHRPQFGRVHELKRLKFLGRITPGDTITIKVRFEDQACDFEIDKPGERCAGGRMTFVDP